MVDSSKRVSLQRPAMHTWLAAALPPMGRRKLTRAPTVGLAALGLAYALASLTGIFAPLMDVLTLELLPLLAAIMMLGECGPRVLGAVTFVMVLQLPQSRDLWAHTASGLPRSVGIAWRNCMHWPSFDFGWLASIRAPGVESAVAAAPVVECPIPPPMPQLLTRVDDMHVPL